MTGPDDAARMAAGIRAIAANAASLRIHDELGHGAPPPPEIADRPGRAEQLLAQTVPCRFCKVGVGRPCELAKGRPMAARFHPLRLKAAQANAARLLAEGAS